MCVFYVISNVSWISVSFKAAELCKRLSVTDKKSNQAKGLHVEKVVFSSNHLLGKCNKLKKTESLPVFCISISSV